MNISNSDNICVVGGGPLGAITCLGIAKALPNNKIYWVKGEKRAASQRSVAVMKPGIDYLKSLDIDFDSLTSFNQLKGLRLVDITQNLLSAPETLFMSEEIGLDYFALGLNDNLIVSELNKKISTYKNIIHFDVNLKSIIFENNLKTLCLENNEKISVSAILACDGKFSLTRKLADISHNLTELSQVALTTNLTITGDHNLISTEFHTKDGPFTFVPNGEKQVNLVTMLDRKKAEYYASDLSLLKNWVNQQSFGLLGHISSTITPQIIPLHKLTVSSLYKNGVFLVGDSAHAFPPIGAQGFNLGLRDVKSLIDLFSTEASLSKIGADYQKARFADIKFRTQAVMSLNQSLLSGLIPISPARAVGLSLIKQMPALKRKIMKAGMGNAYFS